MPVINLQVSYRPVRIGWCVRTESYDNFRKALRLTHAFWGGRYNPIIPVDDEALADDLVKTFRVDALYAVSDDPMLHQFIGRYRHLRWPIFHQDLFVQSARTKIAVFLDVSHSIRQLYQEYVRSSSGPTLTSRMLEWQDDDPLSDVFLVTFGGYPSPDEIGIDYGSQFRELLGGETVMLEKGGLLSGDIARSLTPSTLTTYKLQADYLARSGPYWPGFYFGSVSNLSDLINYWNLRAANIELLFYDEAHKERLEPLRDAFIHEALHPPPDFRGSYNDVAVRDLSDKPSKEWSRSVPITRIDSLNVGLGMDPRRTPPVMRFPSRGVLASVSDEDRVPYITFALPDKPFFYSNQFYLQHVVVSVQPYADFVKPDVTVHTPYIPELNPYLGDACYSKWFAVRAEAEGLGIITHLPEESLRLRAVETRRLFTEIFKVYGMRVEPSQAGLITAQLIQQMGGLQGCRVFKIAGVRDLIESYSPSQSFTRSVAIMAIRQYDQATKRVNFEKYQDLHIGYRRGGTLQPEDAFLYLVERGVFRAGLEFKCWRCQLEFWLSIDEVRTVVKCEYCGNEFNVTTQLRDRDWRYRRSGLFGRSDNQEGAIPVILTLQQIDTVSLMRSLDYTTSVIISPESAQINKCESDFVILTRDYGGDVQIGIGECKTRGEITEQDVDNLRRVADAFPVEQVKVFIIFSKLGPFTEEEIERCRKAQGEHEQRVILLSPRELEPYFIYEEAAKEFQMNKTAISLMDLAEATHNIYFDPTPLE